MTVTRFAAVACIALAAAGCARFEFYPDAEMKGTETGIRIYPAKPYLLVAHTGDPTKPVDVSVQYIPDLSKPVFAKAQSGWGNSNLTMTFSNGIMTQFGQQVDANTSGIVSSLGTLATSVGGLKSTQGLQGTPPKDAPQLEFSLYEIDNSSGTTVLRPVPIPR